MKKNEVQIGGVYTAKVSDKVVQVRVDAEKGTGWSATNLVTGKAIYIKSAQRLREAVSVATDGPEITTKAPARGHTAKKTDGRTTKAKPAKVATRGKQGGQGGKKVSCLDAAARVLAESDEPLNTKQMIETMGKKGLWTSPAGKTPHATLYSAILREINAKGNGARFKKTERGKFAAMAFAGQKDESS